MRPLGTIVMSIAVLIAAWSAVSPVSIDTLGRDYDCGAPIVRLVARESSDDPNEQGRIDRCEDRALRPVLSAAVIVTAGLIGGLVIRRSERRQAARIRARRARDRAAAMLAIEAVEAEPRPTGPAPPGAPWAGAPRGGVGTGAPAGPPRQTSS